MIFDYFHESDCIPEDHELYASLKYPMIGLLLKEHPEVEYTDVSYYEIQEENSKLDIFLFYTSKEVYVYTSNGIEVRNNKDHEGNKIFKLNINKDCYCELTYEKEGEISYSFQATDHFDLEEFKKKVKFDTQHHYSKREDILYWIKEGLDIQGNLNQKLELINKRIKDREEKIPR